MKTYVFFFLSLSVCFFACNKNEQVAPITPTDPVVVVPPVTQKPNPDTIVIMGSSTAAGVGATPSDSSWVNRLRLSTLENKKSLYYINLAVAGQTTYQGMPAGYSASRAADTAKNITKALSYHPKLVIITYPTNDIALDYTDDEIMGNYKEMVRLLDSAKVNYILFGSQPRNFPDVAYRQRLKTLNDKMKAAYPDHFNNTLDTLGTADYSIKPALSFGDGVHVNNAGHYIIVQSVLAHPVFQQIIK